MAQLRDIKTRIDSVKKTKKITQAMKMVAASKFKRASTRVMKARAYKDGLEALLAETTQGDFQSDFLSDNGSDRHAIILVSGERGLCGGFNANILKFLTRTLEEQSGPVDLYYVGQKGYQHFRNVQDIDSKGLSEITGSTISFEACDDYLAPIVDRFLTGEIGRLSICYNQFVSAISTNQVIQTLLPLSLDAQSSDDGTIGPDYFYEPDKNTILDKVIAEYMTFNLYQALLESKAGEEGARMAAMDSATQNASDMMDQLTLLYNRSRQAQITTELSEIVAGAEALVA